MSIQYSMTAKENLLLVEASGFDESLEEVEQYGMAIIRACQENKCTRVLCDELALEYRLSTFDTFESASFIARHAPHVGSIAIVCNETFIKDAQFWETVAVNRGLTVRAFKELEQARQWLDS